MGENIFLIIDNIPVDGIEEGGYTAYEQELGVSERMISGRLVEEIRGKVWVVEVSYNDIDVDTMGRLQAAMGGMREHRLQFLPPAGGVGMASGQFAMTMLPQPTLSRWLPGTLPQWAGYTMRFEEVTPHD